MQRRIRIQPRFWIFAIAVMLVSFLTSCAVAQMRYTQVSNRLNALTAERFALKERVNALSAQLDYVRTDAYVERVARDELNMLRPGEVRYVSN